MAVDIRRFFNIGNDPWGNPRAIGATNPQTPYTTNEGLFGILSVIIKNVFVIAGIILFIFIIVGGLGMIINAGNAEKQKKSSNVLGSAITGFIIMIVSYWIVKIIELLTGTSSISF